MAPAITIPVVTHPDDDDTAVDARRRAETIKEALSEIQAAMGRLITIHYDGVPSVPRLPLPLPPGDVSLGLAEWMQAVLDWAKPDLEEGEEEGEEVIN